MEQQQYIMKSPIGPLHLVATPKGLQGIYWKKQPVSEVKSLNDRNPTTQILQKTQSELHEYFQGQRQKFTVPLDLRGTEFQKKVWAQLLKIPYGKTVSYSQIAQNIKNSKAVRAVGTANGKNPVSIMIPCHRVISADGTLGGYAGGLSKKTQLLAIEQGSR